ncbi:TIGR02302 family protein [Roseovarius ramblicola]|uniref:TIGR02302 family protein n=1 Tax=Roseovarius ramblicola TaxID=2022336 RepID=A0ABV5HXP7_9RHOB
MSRPGDPLVQTMARLRPAVALTWAGLVAERVTRAFWPLLSLLAAVAGAAFLGLHDHASPVVLRVAGAALGVIALALAAHGLLRLRWPRRADAVARLDASLDGHPLAALGDAQAIGTGDDASAAVWRAHQARMATRAAGARHVPPDLRLARLDPYGLRHVALLVLVIGLVFGSVWRAGTVTQMGAGGGAGAALAQGPAWEGWIEPPRHTGLPSLYLADQEGVIRAPVGSEVTLRFYGAEGALSLYETASGGGIDAQHATAPEQSFDIIRDGVLRIDGPGGRDWQVEAMADAAPSVAVLEAEARTSFEGQMSQPFEVRDDHGVTGGHAVITLDMERIARRHGLAAEPEPREPIRLDLPLPMMGDRAEFTETLIANLSQHAWAHLPVTLRMTVTDAIGQDGKSDPVEMTLPARRFFDPLAAAVIEQRRDLLWSRENATRVTQVLRAISYKPSEGLFRSSGAYLQLRTILRRLESMVAAGGPDKAGRDEIAKALWNLGVLIEDGDVGDALERMRAAQERLSEAMKNGASEDEIARLMQELRDATQDYLRQKMQQAQREDENGGDQQSAENSMRMSQQDLQDMMDRIQELMEQGRFAEAQRALEEFQRMMENMQVTEGQSGSEGQQAMEGLADTLRGQQGLSDQAFRDLQEQFNPNAQSGQSQQNEGSSGGEGRGESHDGQQGQGGGEGGTRPGGQGQDGREQAGESEGGSLAERQEALRRQLEQQRRGLPQLGGEAGDAARDSLERAERSMEGAEEALRNDDLAGALEDQADAMEALREGMRSMGEAMARDSSPGSPGGAQGESGRAQADPLGRESGQGRHAGTQDSLLQGEDVYRRARDLLDEIRRRSGEGARPDIELDYLRRLLDRF